MFRVTSNLTLLKVHIGSTDCDSVFICSIGGGEGGFSLSSALAWKRLCEYAGLSEYEARVYVSLVEAGAAKARKLSAMCGVPRTKVYSVLKKLADMGLIVEIPEDPRKFAPKPPKDAFESYLRSYQNRARNLLLVISSLEKVFKETKDGIVPQKADLWIMQGRQEILQKMQEMLSKAKKTVRIVTNENGSILLFKTFGRLFDELKERSIKVRIMTPLGSNNKYALNELRYTCAIELFDMSLPMIFLHVDRNEYILADLKPDDFSLSSGQDTAVFSDDQNLCEMIYSILCSKANRNQDSVLEKKRDLTIVK